MMLTLNSRCCPESGIPLCNLDDKGINIKYYLPETDAYRIRELKRMKRMKDISVAFNVFCHGEVGDLPALKKLADNFTASMEKLIFVLFHLMAAKNDSNFCSDGQEPG